MLPGRSPRTQDLHLAQQQTSVLPYNTDVPTPSFSPSELELNAPPSASSSSYDTESLYTLTDSLREDLFRVT